jgi:hypothetical protein
VQLREQPNPLKNAEQQDRPSDKQRAGHLVDGRHDATRHVGWVEGNKCA